MVEARAEALPQAIRSSGAESQGQEGARASSHRGFGRIDDDFGSVGGDNAPMRRTVDPENVR